MFARQLDPAMLFRESLGRAMMLFYTTQKQGYHVDELYTYELMNYPGSFYALTGGFVLYGMGAIVWLGVLSKWEVSKAYPLVGLGFVFTVLVGFMLNEQIGLLRLAGVCFICAGVFMVGKS